MVTASVAYPAHDRDRVFARKMKKTLALKGRFYIIGHWRSKQGSRARWAKQNIERG
jgi:hypothetical protein